MRKQEDSISGSSQGSIVFLSPPFFLSRVLGFEGRILLLNAHQTFMAHSNPKLKPQSRLWSITTYAVHTRVCKGSRKYWEEAGIGLPEYMLDTAHSLFPLCAYWSPHNNPGKWVSLSPEQKPKTKVKLGKWAISKFKREWIPILPHSSEEGVPSYWHQHPEVQVGL